MPQKHTMGITMAKTKLWVILLIAALLSVASLTGCGKSAALEDLTGRYENVTRLTIDPANDGSSVWSPDGSKIAFVTGKVSEGKTDRGIYVIDVLGS